MHQMGRFGHPKGWQIAFLCWKAVVLSGSVILLPHVVLTIQYKFATELELVILSGAKGLP